MNVSPISNIADFDFVPPAPVADLRLTGTTSTTVTLALAAPGDDGYSGTAIGFRLNCLSGSLPRPPPQDLHR